MLLCCLRRNVEASYRKHFVVVVSRHQQNDAAYQRRVSPTCRVRRSCVYNTGRSNRWQHAMKPDIGWGHDFCLPYLHSRPVRGFASEYCSLWVWPLSNYVVQQRAAHLLPAAAFSRSHSYHPRCDSQTCLILASSHRKILTWLSGGRYLQYRVLISR